MKPPNLLISTVLLSILATSNAQAVYCEKKVHAHSYNYTGVNGNWAPWHNTNNYRYQVVKPGKDVFQHKRRPRAVGTKCKNGTYIIDHWSNGKDACRKTVTQIQTQTTSAISTQQAGGVNGNWGPMHNTNNWEYQRVKPGKDYFLHKRGRRAVATKCKSGNYKVDYWSDGRDACLKTVYSCPSGYTLVP